MYIYKVVSTGNYYSDYKKAVCALRCEVGKRFKESDITYDNLDVYFDADGKVNTNVDNIPQIVCIDDNDESHTFEIHRINVR